MARARLLKPGFFTNDDLAELPMAARLLFAGLWTLADRAGRLEDRPRRIKAEVLPYDDVDIEHLLTSLASRGFILRYAVAGSGYIAIVNFGKHQSPHVREPESAIPAPDEHDASTVQAPDEYDASPSSRAHSPIPHSPNHNPIPEAEAEISAPFGAAGEPPVLSERQIKHRAMFAALSASFGVPTPGEEKGRYESAAKALVTAGVDPSEIPRLHEAWPWVNPGEPRVNSLAKQLTVLRNARPPTPTARAPNGQYQTAGEKATAGLMRLAERNGLVNGQETGRAAVLGAGTPGGHLPVGHPGHE